MVEVLAEVGRLGDRRRRGPGWWRTRARARTASGVVPPTRSKLRSCSTRSSLALQLQRQVADLVEEQVPAVGQLEAPGACRLAPVNAPRSWPNSSDSDQLLGNRRAVDRDERLRRARAAPVDGARHQLLADAALALDQHAQVVVGEHHDALEEFLRRGTLADQLADRRRRCVVFCDRRHRIAVRRRVQRALQQAADLRQLQRLAEVVEGAGAHASAAVSSVP